MGRLPAEFAGRRISSRIPYSMPGELIVQYSTTGVQFPEATFAHNIDKPFEIHRVIPRVTGMTSTGVVMITQPSEAILEATMRIRIHDFSKNESLTKNAQLISSFTKGSAEKSWEFAEPYTIVRAEGFQVTVDNICTTAIAGGGTYDGTRLALTFQGFLLVVARPDERG